MMDHMGEGSKTSVTETLGTGTGTAGTSTDKIFMKISDEQ